MSTARVQALAGGLARDAVTKSFQEIASKADRLGFVPYELEPRFVLAEIEVGPGRSGQRAKRARVIAKRGHGQRLRPHCAQGRRRSERSYASELTHSSKARSSPQSGCSISPPIWITPGWLDVRVERLGKQKFCAGVRSQTELAASSVKVSERAGIESVPLLPPRSHFPVQMLGQCTVASTVAVVRPN